MRDGKMDVTAIRPGSPIGKDIDGNADLGG
jgi:hypothetical protein